MLGLSSRNVWGSYCVELSILVARAGAGEVLVSGSVAESAPPQGVTFVELGELRLDGFARPVRLLEARRA